MAKIVEEVVTVKISRIVKDDDPTVEAIVNDDVLTGIEAITEQLVGEHGVVEVTHGA